VVLNHEEFAGASGGLPANRHWHLIIANSPFVL
jgi:hypothetical protein